MTESQSKLVMEDMIADLMGFSTAQIEKACDVWRKKNVAYFPNSGQLIACIQENQEASIANARANRPAFQARQYDRLLPPRNGKLKPWQEILREHGLRLGEKRR